MKKKSTYHMPKLSLLLKIFSISLLFLYIFGFFFGTLIVSLGLSDTYPINKIIPELMDILLSNESFLILKALPIFSFLAFIFSIFAWTNLVRIDKSGLTVYNSFSRISSIQWQNIKSIKSINIAGLRYLRIDSIKNRQPLYLPLFLKEMSLVNSLIKSFSGDNYKLFRILEEKII